MASEQGIVKWVIQLRLGTCVGPFDDPTSALIFAEEAKLDVDDDPNEAIRELISPSGVKAALERKT